MDRKQRVFWKDNTSLVDISVEVNSYLDGTKVLPIVALEDAIYIGSELPFNHKYIEVIVPNDVASVLSVAIWDGSNWQAAVDVIDETKVAGKTLAQSGVISFNPDIDISNWQCERDSNDIPALEGTRIFNLYWCRLTFSANLKATTAITYVGQLFSNDEQLRVHYPGLMLEDFMLAYEEDKEDWKKQHIAAAEHIVADLRNQGVVIRRDQIMDSTLFNMAAVHKCASIIYGGIENMLGLWDAAQKKYIAALNVKYPEVDVNGDGMADGMEKTFSTQWGTR